MIFWEQNSTTIWMVNVVQKFGSVYRYNKVS